MTKITLWTPNGAQGTVIETEATSKSQLEAQLKERGINTNSMKFIIGETKNELVANDSLLPAEMSQFTLFLLPEKTKSGTLTVREQVKKIITTGGDKAKKHFNEDKNWTNKTADVLQSLLTKWYKKNPEDKPEEEVQTSNVKAVTKKTATPKKATIPAAKKEVGGIVGSLIGATNAAVEAAQAKTLDALSLTDEQREAITMFLNNFKQGIVTNINNLLGTYGTTKLLGSPSASDLTAQARTLARQIKGVDEYKIR